MRQRLGDYEERDNFLGVVASEDRVAELSEQRRIMPMALITLAAMAVFAGGLWFAYVQGARHAAPAAGGGATAAVSDNAPLIRADQRPVKVRPEQPGGMDVPDRDKLVFNEKDGGPPVERLLPPPEAPAPLPPPAAKPAAVPPSPVAAVPSPVVDAKPVPGGPLQSSPEPAKTAPAKSAVEKPAAARPAAQPVPVRAGAVRVQLGSLRSPDAAREEWHRLKRLNADLLGRLTAVAIRADVPDKGIYYRIEAGPLADATAAGRLCGELRKRKLGCTIVR